MNVSDTILPVTLKLILELAQTKMWKNEMQYIWDLEWHMPFFDDWDYRRINQGSAE